MKPPWYWPETRSKGIVRNILIPDDWDIPYLRFLDNSIAAMAVGRNSPFEWIDNVPQSLPSNVLLLWLYVHSPDDRYFWFGF
jgi:hypothetical protein